MSTGTIIALIVTVVVIGISIYFAVSSVLSSCPVGSTYDNIEKRCVPACNPTNQVLDARKEKCIPACTIGGQLRSISEGEESGPSGECRQICPPGKLRCDPNIYEASDTCYDPQTEVCTADLKFCSKDRACQVPPGPGRAPQLTCCDKHCADPTATSSVCYDQCLPTETVCGDKCCPVGSGCLGGACCADTNRFRNPTLGVEECCARPLCNGTCCDPTQDCNPATNSCATKCGDRFCDTDTEICYTSQTGAQSCVARSSCAWEAPEITPARITRTITGPKLAYNVCLKSDSTSWIADRGNPDWMSKKCDVEGEANCVATATTNVQCQNEDLCKDQLNYGELANITQGASIQTPTQPGGKARCYGQLNCTRYLSQNPQGQAGLNAMCSDLQSDPNLQGICCKDANNVYTGQICRPGTQCTVDGKCVTPQICNNHGILDTTKPGGVCTCYAQYYSSAFGQCDTELGFINRGGGSTVPFNLNNPADLYTVNLSNFIQGKQPSNRTTAYVLLILLPGMTISSNPFGLIQGQDYLISLNGISVYTQYGWFELTDAKNFYEWTLDLFDRYTQKYQHIYISGRNSSGFGDAAVIGYNNPDPKTGNYEDINNAVRDTSLRIGQVQVTTIIVGMHI